MSRTRVTDYSKKVGAWRRPSKHEQALIEARRKAYDSGFAAGLKYAAELADGESHKPGAQGYSGGPRALDFHRFSQRLFAAIEARAAARPSEPKEGE